MRLQGGNGTWFEFDAGALSLEFVNTGTEQWRSFLEPADLARWAAQSRLADPAEFTVADVHATDEHAAHARSLQACLASAFDSVVGGGAPGRESVAGINSTANSPPPVPLLEDGGARYAVPITGEQILSAVARDAVDLLAGDEVARIRRCDGHGCDLVFLDLSRSGRRRWCSMDRCGNRAKQRRRQERSPENPS